MTMTELTANKTLVRRLFEKVIDAGNTALADELLRPDYIQHNPSVGQGIEGFKEYFASLDQTKRRLRLASTMDILAIMAEGDRVSIYTETRMVGMVSLSFQAMDLFRIQDGKIAEHWDVIQGRGLLSATILLAVG